MNDFYDVPTMVSFLDPNYLEEDGDKYYLGGIAYQDCIICGCCGGTFAINELKEIEEKLEFRELPWIDINEAIIGD